MSLQYIIDGYNIINHPRFPDRRKSSGHPSKSLSDFIRDSKLTGSSRNTLVIVFDGYPPSGETSAQGCVVFSRKISADEKIKMLIEERGARKNIVVVSDDKEIRSAAASLGARRMSVDDFIGHKSTSAGKGQKQEGAPELTYTQMHKINEELKRIWLK